MPEKFNFPFEINQVEDDTNAELLRDFKGERSHFLQVGPKKYFFPSGYKENASVYYNFQSRKDDVWIITYPRSGTTWTQEMVWLLANDLNFKKASEILLTERFPFLEFSSFVHKEVREEILNFHKMGSELYEKTNEVLSTPAWEVLDNVVGPRFIKTHLPFSLLAPNLLETGCKVIYVARNPKDVAVSFYHLNRMFRTQGYTGDFQKYWYYFKNSLQPWAPYFEHLKEGRAKRSEKNVLFMFYEEFAKDLRGGIQKVADFLGKQYTDGEYERLENHLRIENFKNNDSVNSADLKEKKIINENEGGFVRNGKTGGWMDYFTVEMRKEADDWINENLRNSDINFV